MSPFSIEVASEVSSFCLWTLNGVILGVLSIQSPQHACGGDEINGLWSVFF